MPTYKRVVLLHRNGMHQILGVLPNDQQPPSVLTRQAGVLIDHLPVELNLIQSKARYVIYREIMVPEGLGSFDKAQR